MIRRPVTTQPCAPNSPAARLLVKPRRKPAQTSERPSHSIWRHHADVFGSGLRSQPSSEHGSRRLATGCARDSAIRRAVQPRRDTLVLKANWLTEPYVNLSDEVIVKDPDILGGTPVFRGTRV